MKTLISGYEVAVYERCLGKIRYYIHNKIFLVIPLYSRITTKPDKILSNWRIIKLKAIVLLSGGLDSTVCMSIAYKGGYELLPISFNYGQRHNRELECAGLVAKHYKVTNHLIINTNMDKIGGSALTDGNIGVPEGDISTEDIPVTYVPARNLIFLSYALGYAEVQRAQSIFIGVNAVDYSGYPDCRPEFISKFQSLADYSTKAVTQNYFSIEIKTPLINFTKAEIIKTGTENQAPLHLTTSCYNGREAACGLCDSCKLRLKGFAQAGVEDQIKYEVK